MQLQQGRRELNRSIPRLSSTATGLVPEAEYGSVTPSPGNPGWKFYKRRIWVWGGGSWVPVHPTSPKLLSWSQVIIRRRPLFYAVSLLLPSIFLMVVDIVGFCLPPDSGERVSFKITLLLGYSVFLIIVSDTLPATAIGTPLIGKASLREEFTVCDRDRPCSFPCLVCLFLRLRCVLCGVHGSAGDKPR